MNYAASLIISTCVVFHISHVLADDNFGGIQSQHADMKGYTIIEVGNATEVRPPIGKNWEKDLYQLFLSGSPVA